MNDKRARSQRKAKAECAGDCLCQGFGLALTEFFRRLGPPSPARKHFETARVEVLKGLRAILDARIEQCSGGGAKAGGKGQKINVD